jgi:hypothetical protein
VNDANGKIQMPGIPGGYYWSKSFFTRLMINDDRSQRIRVFHVHWGYGEPSEIVLFNFEHDRYGNPYIDYHTFRSVNGKTVVYYEGTQEIDEKHPDWKFFSKFSSLSLYETYAKLFPLDLTRIIRHFPAWVFMDSDVYKAGISDPNYPIYAYIHGYDMQETIEHGRRVYRKTESSGYKSFRDAIELAEHIVDNRSLLHPKGYKAVTKGIYPLTISEQDAIPFTRIVALADMP